MEPHGSLLAGGSGILRADLATGCLWLEQHAEPAVHAPAYKFELQLVGLVHIDWAGTPSIVRDSDNHVLATVGERIRVTGGLVGHLTPGCPGDLDGPLLGEAETIARF